jgi:hypothetical protein
MGVGAIVRGHHDTRLVACRQQMDGLLSPELAEALALRRGVELAQDEGLDNAIFETNCLPLVHRLNSSTMDISYVDIVGAGIKHMVRGFTLISFRRVKRVHNEAAHHLAKSCEDGCRVQFYLLFGCRVYPGTLC